MKNVKILWTMALVAMLLFSSISFGVSGNEGQENDNAMIIDAYMVGESLLEIVVDDISYAFDSINTRGQSFTKLAIEGESSSLVVGEAELPVINRFVEIPFGAEPIVTVESSSWSSTSLSDLGMQNQIIPVQPSVEKTMSPEDVDFAFNQPYYSQDAWTSSVEAEVVDTVVIRGHRFALVQFNPVEYNPASGELRLMQDCVINIGLPDADFELTAQKNARYDSDAFDGMFEGFLNVGAFASLPSDKDAEGYLIIVDDGLESAISSFESWKASRGFSVTLTKTSDIPGGASSSAIQSYIQTAYDTWSPAPSYVLLVGDTAEIPTFNGQQSYTGSDLYYVTTDGSDYFPDIHIGRFSGSTTAQISAMVDKTVYYETGSFPDPTYMTNAVFMASTDNYQVSEGTHNYVINNYLDPNGYTSEKLYTVTYSATTQDVRDAFNAGKFLGVYSGHGGSYSWADGPPFSQSDVNGLTNSGEYSFVFSHACVTGTFTLPECFGETWIRAANKAGIIFWGSSANTMWGEDDILEKKVFAAWFDSGITDFGGMTDKAKVDLYQHYSGGGYSRYYFECYNILGDPSVDVTGAGAGGNQPPSRPSKPNGPIFGVMNEPYTYWSQTTDPEGSNIQYRWDFDDGTVTDWSSSVPSGTRSTVSHVWDANGVYDVRVQARDINESESVWSYSLRVEIEEENYAPPTPDAPVGPSQLAVDEQGVFSVVGTDPDEDQITYRLSWGDGTYSDWTDLVDSGVSVDVPNAWDVSDTYNVRVQVKDTREQKSGWSDALQVAIFDETNAPPVVSISSPSDGATVSEVVRISGSASDPDGDETLHSVELSINGNFYTAVGKTSWYFDWNTEAGENGEYEITARAYDGEYFSALDSISVTVENIFNDPPQTPEISGPSEGSFGTEYTFNFSSIDPDGNDVMFVIDWGDGSTQETGFVSSGQTIQVSHTWVESTLDGETVDTAYLLKAKAVDTLEEESEWGTMDVMMPYEPSSPLLNFIHLVLQRLVEWFPALGILF